jgi:hypothetical protein
MWAHAYVPRHLLETRLAMFGKDVVHLSNKLWRGGGLYLSDYLSVFQTISRL